METIKHPDGTEYKVERRGTGRFYDRFFVYFAGRYMPVYAVNPQGAIDKARTEYAKTLGF